MHGSVPDAPILSLSAHDFTLDFEDILLPVLTDKNPEDRMTLEDKRKSLDSFLKVRYYLHQIL